MFQTGLAAKCKLLLMANGSPSTLLPHFNLTTGTESHHSTLLLPILLEISSVKFQRAGQASRLPSSTLLILSSQVSLSMVSHTSTVLSSLSTKALQPSTRISSSTLTTRCHSKPMMELKSFPSQSKTSPLLVKEKMMRDSTTLHLMSPSPLLLQLPSPSRLVPLVLSTLKPEPNLANSRSLSTTMVLLVTSIWTQLPGSNLLTWSVVTLGVLMPLTSTALMPVSTS
mmetsp:Transcript_34180/g.39870  ORF Transcript_34180/g.39870 Transcript_34180/m.39870 type:complete len:226 (+) Transcript_34180:299-976(+)